jgi:hypothetical protein
VEEILATLTNREIAFLFWSAAFSVWLLSDRRIRPSVLSCLEILASWQVWVLFLYILGLIFFGYSLHIWHFWMLKDTVVWILGTATVLVYSFITQSRDVSKVLLRLIQMNVLVQFVVSTYTFGLLLELTLLPLLVIVGALAAAPPLRKFFGGILITLGLSMFLYAVGHVVVEPDDFFTGRNGALFVLSPILTVLFLPAAYVLSLYSSYEGLFLVLDRIADQKLRRYIKWQLVRRFGVKLGLLSRFRQLYAFRLIRLTS